MSEQVENSEIVRNEYDVAKTNSTYQLSATENPGGIIAQVQFTGDNFDEWAQAIRSALHVKKKYVDGTVVKPKEEAPEYEDWMSVNSIVALWILNTIEPKMLWEDLSNYDQSPTCQCSGCLCDLRGQLEKKREDDKVHQFLLGLDDAVFGGLRTTIISSEPLPNLNQVYSKVKSMERVRTVLRNREEQAGQADFAVQTSRTPEAIEDKRASNHMTSSSAFLNDITTILSCKIGLPDGHETATDKKGTLRCNLISVSQLVKDCDCVMQVANIGCVLHDRTTRMLIGADELREGLYFFRRIGVLNAFHINKDEAEHTWLQRLDHPSDGVFDLLPVVSKRVSDFSSCDVCLQAKQTGDSFHSSNNKASKFFELLHLDVWGPYRSSSTCNSHYFFTIIDDFSSCTWVHVMHDKAQVKTIFHNFLKMVLRKFDQKVQTVRSDNGTEFLFVCTTCLLNKEYFTKRHVLPHRSKTVALSGSTVIC
ncbi:PREDICTED: uncharacterized protein LOC109125405 [Camelina sativa]|uniref:Uncharacterized protein LOC109125405 n=1 Tax=Camelina sativa TaxID=90675 RepID=A0ABM1Q727_CAMSA|nr:PREDICTED: uncharacterized protein LOC109125405 [Camelina sativa]